MRALRFLEARCGSGQCKLAQRKDPVLSCRHTVWRQGFFRLCCVAIGCHSFFHPFPMLDAGNLASRSLSVSLLTLSRDSELQTGSTCLVHGKPFCWKLRGPIWESNARRQFRSCSLRPTMPWLEFLGKGNGGWANSPFSFASVRRAQRAFRI